MVRINKFIISILISVIFGSSVYAQGDLSSAIEAYQSGNYTTCIENMKLIVKDDPTSVIGYYYLGLSYTMTGQELLAIQNYNKVINLNSDSTLTKLARQGKAAINNSSKIENQLRDITEDIKETVEEEYNPILQDGSSSAAQEVPAETQNKKNPIPAKTTQTIKASDYARATSKPVNNPNAQPTNDDIVNAIRTLQKAGLLQNGAAGLVGGQGGAQMPMQMPMDPRTQQMNSMLMMMNNNGNNNGMMNMMPYMNNGGKVDPQLMQMMLMNQMMPNFSGGGNNGGGY